VPTITDANLALGLLDPERAIGKTTRDDGPRRMRRSGA
jgi:hypothetical protein